MPTPCTRPSHGENKLHQVVVFQYADRKLLAKPIPAGDKLIPGDLLLYLGENEYLELVTDGKDWYGKRKFTAATVDFGKPTERILPIEKAEKLINGESIYSFVGPR